MYVQHLVDIFREVRRVLRDDGCVFLNLGDCYQSGSRGGYSRQRAGVSKNKGRGDRDASDFAGAPNRRLQRGLKAKDLVGIPWMVAFALRADGWYLRSEIIWAKAHEFCSGGVGSTMPESIRDRPTRAHETVFLFTKNGGNPLLWRARDTGEIVNARPNMRDWFLREDGRRVRRWEGMDYYYDYQAVQQQGVYPGGTRAAKGSGTREGNRRGRTTGRGLGKEGGKYSVGVQPQQSNSGGYAVYSGKRNLRDVWFISPKPFSDWGYDFGAADYVDARGIPRKWSPGCPEHERDGRPRRSSHVSVACDGQEGDSFPNNERNGSDLEPGPPCGCESIPCCSTQPETDIQPSSPRQRKASSNKSASPATEQSGTAPHSERIPPSSVEPTPDLLPLADDDFASGHNNETSRTAHADHCVEGDVGGDGRPDHRPCNSLSDSVGDGNSRTNRTGEAGPGCVSAGRASHTARSRSRKSYEHDTCNCRVSQTSHFATFPEKLVEPCILAGSRPGDVVLDPFSGSGTVARVAERLGRRWIGTDLNPQYHELAKARIDQRGLRFSEDRHEPAAGDTAV